MVFVLIILFDLFSFLELVFSSFGYVIDFSFLLKVFVLLTFSSADTILILSTYPRNFLSILSWIWWTTSFHLGGIPLQFSIFTKTRSMFENLFLCLFFLELWWNLLEIQIPQIFQAIKMYLYFLIYLYNHLQVLALLMHPIFSFWLFLTILLWFSQFIIIWL